MRRLVYGEDERCVAWAEATMPECKFRNDARTIGMERDGELVGVVVFDTFTRNSCLVHVVSNKSFRWMTREFIVHVFAYPFITCGFNRVTCTVAESNTASINFTRHFGWVEEGRLREEAEDGGDMLVFGMLRRECRWLPLGAGMPALFQI